MIINYLIYLNTLPDEVKKQQLIIAIIFFLSLSAIFTFLEIAKFKFKDKNILS